MKLEISGVSKINNATVELNGITVVAGENNTGKSTIGKILFAMSDFMYGFDEYVESDIKNAIYKEVGALGDILDVISKEHYKSNKQFRRKTSKVDSLQKEYVDKIYILFTNHNKSKLSNNLEQYAKRHVELYQVNYEECKIEINVRISDISDKLKELFILEDHELGTGSVTSSFEMVFNDQINSLEKDNNIGEIILTDDYGKKSIVKFKDNRCYFVECNTPVNENAIFIENPRAIDLINRIPRFYHRGEYHFIKPLDIRRENLKQILRPNNNYMYKMFYNKVKDSTSDINITLAQKKLGRVKELLKKAVSGEYKTENGELFYQENDTMKPIKLENLSTGLKAMILLEQIISVGLLQEKAILILDEPEINLHPEWQLLYAEIIVLLQQVYNLNIVITTHSPYFLKAIEMYVNREKIQSKCKYYATENIDNKFLLSDMSNNINSLFRMLAEPLRYLQKMEYEVGMEE